MWHCHGDVVDNPPESIGYCGHIIGHVLQPAPGDGCIIVEQPYGVWSGSDVAFAPEFGPVRTKLLKVVKATPISAANRLLRTNHG